MDGCIPSWKSILPTLWLCWSAARGLAPEVAINKNESRSQRKVDKNRSCSDRLQNGVPGFFIDASIELSYALSRWQSGWVGGEVDASDDRSTQFLILPKTSLSSGLVPSPS